MSKIVSIEQIDVIDFISIDQDDKNVVLTISDHLSWNDKDHLNLLQTKINSYLGFVESGELFENYPDAKGRSDCIRLACKYELNSIAKDFVDYMKIALAKENIDFSYKLG